MLKRVLPAGLVVLLAFLFSLSAQEFRGTISGTVTDSSGASVPKANIEVKNVDNGQITTAVSNDTGSYTVPFLLPGSYKLTVTATGFKQAVRQQIELHSGDKTAVDITLEVGAAAESITVTAEGEQLVTATAAMGQVTTSDEIRDLPILGRNIFMAAATATGMNSGLYNQKVSQFGRPFDGAAAQMSAGGLGSQYQIYLNGIPNAPEERGSAAIYVGFVPSPDSVQEVNVQTNLYDAQYGHTSGAVINTVLRGGTNELHGTAYEFFRNDKLNANQFEANYAGAKRGVMRWNQPGFVLSGPVYLPKVYDGRNKTFFMLAMELIRNANPTPFTGSVPTAAEKAGDFSALTTSSGSAVSIYDPLTTTLTGGSYLRTQFPGNVIPSTRINAVGQKLMNYYPTPNVPGTAGGFSNYVNSPNSQQDKYHSVSGRVDQQFAGGNKLTVTGFSNVRNQYYPTAGFADEASPGYLHYRNNHGLGVNYTATLTPTTVLDVKYGFIFHPFQLQYYGDNFDLTKLGFSSAFARMVPHQTFPGTSMSGGYSGLQNAGSQFSTTTDHSFSGTISKVAGKHTLKFGGEWFSMRANNITPVSNVNAFSFNSGYTQYNALNSAANAGNPFASMMIGAAASGAVSYNIAYAFQQIYYGAFFQDDIRVNSRLTLNLGLRWDYEGPMSERYNRQNRGFDFNVTNPLQSSVSGLTLKGGLLFTDKDNRLPFKRDLNNWQPRVGAAYRLFNNTVMRAGFGSMYPPTFQHGNANGYSVSTSYVASTDGGLTPDHSLTDPFPSGITQPPGRSLGLSTLLGQGYTFSDPERVLPRIYQYSLGFQQQLPRQTLLDVSFAGNYAAHMTVSKGINALTKDYYAYPGQATPYTSSYLLTAVTNPMAGLLPGSGLNGATTTRQNLLLPYPEFGGITEQYRPLGNSLYNSLQVSVSKRLSAGLSARVSYTWNKIMQATGYMSDQDVWTDLMRVQSSEPTKVMNISVSYKLPIFQNGNGLSHRLLGGWETNVMGRYSNGYLVSSPYTSAYSTGVNPKLSNRSYSQWFNTCSVNTSGVRQNCASSDQAVAFIQLPSYTMRTMTSTLPGIRSEIPFIVDFSMFKTFMITEKTKLQFRANAYNLGNTPQFGGPNTSFGSANFGVVSLSQANDARIVELGLKLQF
jgi:hypothetical protein